MLPPFNARGLLPPGVHTARWSEVVSRFGTNAHRLKLLKGLQRALQALRAAGCRTVYIDGSFVTAKKVPGDFDGCWDLGFVDPDLLDPILLTFDVGRRTQKQKYFGELFPAEMDAVVGQSFLEFFQTDKTTGEPKGIVKLDLRRWKL